MPIDPKLTQSINQVLERLPVVVSDIEQRKDYAKNTEFAADVSRLNAFKQQLLIVKDAPSLSPALLTELQSTAKNAIQPLVESLISANVVIAKMGQLNTHRTIEPKDAMDHNVNLTLLQDAIQSLMVCLTPASGSETDDILSKQFDDWLLSLDNKN